MVKSLVTGGAGFIGSQLARILLHEGHEVKVLDNFSSGKKANLAEISQDIQVLEGDVRDEETVERAVKDIDYIFHQAAFVSVPLSMKHTDECFEVNVSGTRNILKSAALSGVSRVVLASSSAVYGDRKAYPLQENAPLITLSPYAASKRANEIYGELFTHAMDLDVVALRYFNVYGPRQSPASDYAAVIPVFLRQALDNNPPVIYGDGAQSRDFIYVGDVARANLLAANSSQTAGEIINICTGKERSILDLWEIIRDLTDGTQHPIFEEERPGDIRRSLGDPGKSRELMDFAPRVSLQEGLIKTMKWMSAHAEKGG